MSMLTIKHVEKDGHESIQQVHNVSLEPDSSRPKEQNAKMLVAFGCTARGGAVDEHGVSRYSTGAVYVMNDAGATVGKYEFD